MIHVSRQLLFRARSFMIISILFAPALATAANAQTPPASPTATTSTSSQESGAAPLPVAIPADAKHAASDSATPATPVKNDSSNNPADQKSSLQELSSYYELESERIAEENTKLKGLYSDGLIARVELEASDKSLAEARAKVEDVRKQIAEGALKAATAPAAGDIAQRPEQTWTTGNLKIDSLIRDSGSRYTVDPYLIYCVISQESAFKTGAISSKGAHGLMQLMPATAARYGVKNPYDPAQSIMGGTRYLKDLLQLFNGRIDLALAGYNAGEGAVMKYGYRVPPYAETRAYVRLISARYSKNGNAALTVKI